jgi:hypothetical protein
MQSSKQTWGWLLSPCRVKETKAPKGYITYITRSPNDRTVLPGLSGPTPPNYAYSNYVHGDEATCDESSNTILTIIGKAAIHWQNLTQTS